MKTPIETVISINKDEDLYFNKGGGLEASLRLHAKISRVMTIGMKWDKRKESEILFLKYSSRKQMKMNIKKTRKMEKRMTMMRKKSSSRRRRRKKKKKKVSGSHVFLYEGEESREALEEASSEAEAVEEAMEADNKADKPCDESIWPWRLATTMKEGNDFFTKWNEKEKRYYDKWTTGLVFLGSSSSFENVSMFVIVFYSFHHFFSSFHLGFSFFII